jgi:hypothetical protein
MDQIAGLAQQKGLYTAKAYQDTLQSLRSQDITLQGDQSARQGVTAQFGHDSSRPGSRAFGSSGGGEQDEGR